MKRMHEFLNPGLHEWEQQHTGTGSMTQDGTVVITNDDDAISANTSTVYQFDHFDKATGKYVFRLVSNQFTFPSAGVGSIKKNGVKFDVDDESLWTPNITVSYFAALVGNAGLYAVPKKNAAGDSYEYKLNNCFANQQNEIYTDGSLEIASYHENGFLNTLKNIFVEAGCNLTADGYYAIIPGEYIEIVSDTPQNTVAKITILPQEIAIAPTHEPVFRLVATQE